MEEIKKIEPTGIFTRYIYKSIPLAFDDSLSYYEMLCALLNKVKNIEEVVNNHADLILELEEYVKNYFDNLDVQEEINNKLDEMAESGELEDIISQYIQLMTTYVYNNVEEMTEATNLVNGSYARTSGFYSYDDGGGAYYKIRTITNEDVIDNILLFALTNDNSLVAELIVTNEMNVKQFGAKDDNIKINNSNFQKAINNIKGCLNINGDIFKLNDTIDVLDKENIELNFNCKIHMASSENAGTSCLRLLRSKNVKVNGYYVYSERDKEESPQGDSTRVSPYGSNIYGLVIRSCENVFINNIYFENMANDFVIGKYDLDVLEDYPKTKKVYIENYISLNASQNNLISNSEDLYYNNIDLTPAINMGGGDHCFYITNDAENIYINNIKIKTQDDYFYIPFQCNTSGTASKNINIINGNIKANGLIYVNKDSDVYFNNIKFYDNETGTTHDYIVSSDSNAHIYFNNCKFENINKSIISTNNSMITNFKYCYFKQRNNIAKDLFNFSSSGNVNLQLDNCKFDSLKNLVFYSGSNVTGNIDISNCYIDKISNYCFSKRNTATKLFLNNTRVINNTGTSISHFSYNGEGADSSNTIYFNLYIKGYNNAGYNRTNLIALSSYLNDTLIS